MSVNGQVICGQLEFPAALIQSLTASQIDDLDLDTILGSPNSASEMRVGDASWQY
jgi:hypothetical protein